MKRGLYLCFIVLTLALCSCAPAQEAPQAEERETVITVTPMPTAQTSPKPTPGFSINPVSAFYALYKLDTDEAVQKQRELLLAQSSIDGIETLLDYNEHCSAVMRPNASVGRLCASGGVYSDTLLGAAAGSGILTPQSSADLKLADSANSISQASASETSSENLRASADDFTFSFSYSSGLRMKGYLRADLLYYAVYPIYTSETVTEDIDEETGHKAEIVNTETTTGDFLYGCYLQRSGDGQWVSLVLRERSLSMLTCQNAQLSFEIQRFGNTLSLQELSFEALYDFMRTGAVASDGQLT